MYNSLLDPNISLSCNLLDACQIIDVRLRTARTKSKGFGPDVTNETFPKLFSMGCYLANALRAEGITGVYKSLPFLYYYHLRRIHKTPRMWLSVRMFSLMPKYAEAKNKQVGAGLIPDFLRRTTSRPLAEAEFNDRGGHRTHGGRPLSFVPEVDAYWLGGDYIDVFKHLGEPLKELLIPMSYAEFEATRPFDASSESALIGTVKQFFKWHDWLPVAALFFAIFFPDRLKQAVDPSNAHGLPSSTDGWLRLLGDNLLFAPEKVYNLFMYGMVAVYASLGKYGVDVLGRQANVTNKKITIK